MIFTLEYAKTYCADFAGEGRSPSDPVVVQKINEATQLLLQEADWKSTLRRMRFRVHNNSIAMPHWVEAVRKVNFSEYTGSIWSMAYEFLEGGPGTTTIANTGTIEGLIDMGDGWATFFPIGETPLKLAAFSTEAGDVGKNIRVRGIGDLHNEIAPTVPGEIIRVQQWQGGVEGQIDGNNIQLSTNEFLSVQSIVKDETAGYVTLFAYDPAAKQPYFLGKYHPYETNPSYRRYRIAGKEVSTEVCITLLVKVRYVPARHDSDVLLIQNPAAIKWMMKAMHEYDRTNVETGANYHQLAKLTLQKQLSDTMPRGSEIDVVINGGYGPEYHTNMV